MQLRRLFSTDSVKGSKGYLDSQKKYEVIRTVLYFGISLIFLHSQSGAGSLSDLKKRRVHRARAYAGDEDF